MRFDGYDYRIVVCKQLKYYDNVSNILWDTDIYVHQGCVRRDILLKTKLLFFISSGFSTYSLIILDHQPHFLNTTVHIHLIWLWKCPLIISTHFDILIPIWCTHNCVPVSKIVMMLELTDFQKEGWNDIWPIFHRCPASPNLLLLELTQFCVCLS